LARSARKSTLFLASLKILVFATAVVASGYVGMKAVTDTNWHPLRPVVRRITPVTHVVPTVERAHSVNIYMVKISGGEASLVAVPHPVAKGVDPKVAAVKKLLTVSAAGGDSAGLIPPGSRLVGLHVDRGLATVDLSREFVGNFHGGSLQESLTLEAITRTLTQFKDVDSVRILVEGRAVDTLGGHFSLSEPLTYKSGRLNAGAKE
jgi:spore germination protein GerM